MSSYDVSRRAHLIQQLLPAGVENLSCLEVGCGTGAISEILAVRVGELTVCDISPVLARNVGERIGTHWSVEDACDLHYANGTFDIVVSSECIEHTRDPCRALVEMVRVLEPGGHLIVTSPNKVWFPLLWVSMVLKLRKFSGRENWVFPWEAARVLQRNGMCDIHIGGCHLFPWQLPFAKSVLPSLDKLGSVLYPVMINFGIRCTKTRKPR